MQDMQSLIDFFENMKFLDLQNGSDVRGVAMPGVEGEDVNFTQDHAMRLGFTFAKWLEEKTGKEQLTFAVGHDSRISGEYLAQAMNLGMVARKHKVFNCGLCTTPAMFTTTIHETIKADAGIMVTASHLPFNRNGVKFFTKEGSLNKKQVREILEMAEKTETPFQKGGTTEKIDFLSVYAADMVDYIRKNCDAGTTPFEGMKIIVDAGNGAGGFFADKVLQPLGADTAGSLYLEPDGSFPNHIPNPEDKTAVTDIKKAVVKTKADLGIIFDTDVDRAAIIDHKGEVINRNRYIALLASIILEQYPGSTVVTDSVTSTGLTDFIENKLGGKHHRFKRGYKNVIDEAIQLNNQGIDCHLAMETSGHGAIKENHFLDDGAYSATRVLIKMAELKGKNKKISSLIKKLKEAEDSCECRYKITAEDYKIYSDNIVEGFRQFAKEQKGWLVVEPNYEGVRVNVDKHHGNGWCLIRASLHDPVIPVNIESNDKDGCEKIKKKIEKYLKDFRDVIDLK